MPTANRLGYTGVAVKNPYSYSQVAVTWDELFAQANVVFGGARIDRSLALDTSGPEVLLGIDTISPGYLQNLEADGTVPVPGAYFNTWLLALVVRLWPNYVIEGPTLFNWGQVVLANPASEDVQVAGGAVTVNSVFNPNFGKLSLLDSRALCFLPNDFVPTGVIPI